MSSYGKRGGEGATRGKKAAVYSVTLPDGTTQMKRDFNPPEGEAAGYCYQHGGEWFVAAIAEPNAPHLSHYTQLPAVRVK